MEFLAIIGIIFILLLISKGLKKLGDGLNNIGDTLGHYLNSRTYSDPAGNNAEKVKEKIRTIKGEGTDEEYFKNVRAEIDDLTKE